MIYRIGLWFLIATICLSASGCQESATQSDRRAQIVGHENIQLKKQLAEKDQEIKRLQGEIKKMEEKAQADAAQQGKTYTKLLQIVSDTSKELEECKAAQSTPAEQ